MSVTDLPARLRAAIDERERLATDGRDAGLDDGWPFWIEVDHEWDRDAADRYRVGFAPSVMLRRCAADRAIVDEVMTWQHHDDDDPWHACRPHPQLGIACWCGLNQRRAAILRALADAYGVSIAASA